MPSLVVCHCIHYVMTVSSVVVDLVNTFSLSTAMTWETADDWLFLIRQFVFIILSLMRIFRFWSHWFLNCFVSVYSRRRRWRFQHLLSEHIPTNSKRKGKGNVDLYSASSRTALKRSDIDHTVLPANDTILPLPICITQAAPPGIHA